MTLEDLRAFVAAYREGSMSAAARRLGCTQGAVAQHVRRLERETESELFVRERRGIAPTAQGTMLYEAADVALRGLDNAVDAIRQSGRAHARRLRITTSSTITTRYLREPLLTLRQRYRDLEIQVETENTAEQRICALREGRADLAVIPLTDPLQSLQVREFGHAELMLMVHPTHRFAKKECLDVADLASIRYIAVGANSGTHRHLERAFRKLDVRFTPSEVVADGATALLLVETGRGETFAPKSIASALENEHGIKAVAIPAVPPLPIVWAARDFSRLPNIAQEFMDVCAELRRRAGTTARPHQPRAD